MSFVNVRIPGLAMQVIAADGQDVAPVEVDPWLTWGWTIPRTPGTVAGACRCATPRGELAFSAQDLPELGIGAGLDHAEFGLRLRYEVSRQFAPYLGVEHQRKFGQSARHARGAGKDAGETSVVAGVRFWF